MIVEWKGKLYNKPYLVRPSSTMGLSRDNYGSSHCFYGFGRESSAPKKYFSKPKAKKNFNNSTTEVYGSGAVNGTLSVKGKVKT